MRWFALLAVGAVAFAIGGATKAAAAPPDGLHGGVQRDFSEFGFQGTWRLAVNATAGSPSGQPVGKVIFTGVDLPLADFGTLSANPIYLQTTADTACVVAEVYSFRGDWPFYTPGRVVVSVRDVPGGPDVFAFIIYPVTVNALDPALACSFATPGMAITNGNFTITGG
jgi:hypothetical protein